MENLTKPISLLLVEDNILNQKLIFLNLAKFGFSIDVAINGKEAVVKLNGIYYDLVLMDLRMPVMDGFEATRKIRSCENTKISKIPIIGLTANTYDADREKCLATGMDEYMTKPFDLEEFFKIIKKLGIL